MKIKKKNTTIPISGKIVDTENVEDKTSNAPSLRLVKEMVKENYSTEEQVIGTWIDGKPLYRKVIENIYIPAKPTASDAVYAYIDLPNNINDIFVKYATVLVNDNNLLLPFIANDGNVMKINSVTISQIMITNKTKYNGTAKLIVEYTKTTD